MSHLPSVVPAKTSTLHTLNIDPNQETQLAWAPQKIQGQEFEESHRPKKHAEKLGQ